jgi:hypothetical protein
MRAVALVLLLGCGSKVDVDDNDAALDSAATDTAAVDTAVTPVDSAIMDVVRDTFVDSTFVDTGPDKRWPITAKDAECMGLTRPVCAGCHFRDGTWYLMPTDVPPPPPDMPADPDAYERCGLKPPGS